MAEAPSSEHNPFLHPAYREAWLRNFRPQGKAVLFRGFQGISFYRRLGPLFLSTGNRLTAGNSYTLAHAPADRTLRKKVLLVFDVPEWERPAPPKGFPLRCRVSTPYPGYIAELGGYADAETFMRKVIRPKSRRGITRARKRLEIAFDVDYRVRFGQAETQKDIDQTLEDLQLLLQKRAQGHSSSHPFLDADNFRVIREAVPEMIQEGKAVLMVVEANGEPAAIGLFYLHGRRLVSAIPAFDPDYALFNPGHVLTQWALEWSYSQGLEALDFSKGHYDYKARWATRKYAFQYHVWYDPRSVRATALGGALHLAFRVYGKLRQWGINTWYHRFKGIGSPGKEQPPPRLQLLAQELSGSASPDLSEKEIRKLRPALFQYAYHYQQPVSGLSLYKTEGAKPEYYIDGRQATCRVQFKA
ncbi:GNAT family N-acetyltransferase [Robiginitalea sp. M366]|uniref:GNAT family N-acetyltransferase n=1 Tax=Robiginitalea aestuariiviva TaxID=3036903 RepID=UPI00240E46BB|nr:GNAT family N-acetyltransferase [Robiginitalea aestuariiviva]MDG1572754.1 GNAT family N-acetyltransferase [Robiginitalea aestuariiviva]